tara:strand:+ start:1031 stop:1258 length:228 start_codon:yes stop_codon:yes gene_type:complete
MNEENRKELWSIIQETGDRLKGKLPVKKSHPKGRNPYAHILLMIKLKFKQSYKDIPDDKKEILIKFIKYIEDNPK